LSYHAPHKEGDSVIIRIISGWKASRSERRDFEEIPKLTPEMMKKLDALKALSDDQIDTRLTDADWQKMKVGLFYRPTKKLKSR
jgi:hypothetical protein